MVEMNERQVVIKKITKGSRTGNPHRNDEINMEHNIQ